MQGKPSSSPIPLSYATPENQRPFDRVRFAGIILAVAMPLTALMSGFSPGGMRASQGNRTGAMLRGVSQAIEAFAQEKGYYPTKQEGLAVLVPEYLSPTMLRDTWGNPIFYTRRNSTTLPYI